eukprot:scaffold1116_cov340-Prasinococcus_capsulatus_cf.AAC.5
MFSVVLPLTLQTHSLRLVEGESRGSKRARSVLTVHACRAGPAPCHGFPSGLLLGRGGRAGGVVVFARAAPQIPRPGPVREGESSQSGDVWRLGPSPHHRRGRRGWGEGWGKARRLAPAQTGPVWQGRPPECLTGEDRHGLSPERGGAGAGRAGVGLRPDEGEPQIAGVVRDGETVWVYVRFLGPPAAPPLSHRQPAAGIITWASTAAAAASSPATARASEAWRGVGWGLAWRDWQGVGSPPALCGALAGRGRARRRGSGRDLGAVALWSACPPSRVDREGASILAVRRASKRSATGGWRGWGRSGTAAGCNGCLAARALAYLGAGRDLGRCSWEGLRSARPASCAALEGADAQSVAGRSAQGRAHRPPLQPAAADREATSGGAASSAASAEGAFQPAVVAVG